MTQHANEEVDFLKMLGRGDFLAELHEKRLSTEQAIASTGKAGELVIKIKITPEGARRIIRHSIAVKAPEVGNLPTMAFATNSGQYVENDPSQMRLPLAEVEQARITTFEAVAVAAAPTPVAVAV